MIPFFAFAPAVRRVIYTTNAIESIHSQLRKIIKTRGHFPSDDAATKLIWLALRNITTDWGRAAKEWSEAMNQFAIAYGDRFTRSTRNMIHRLATAAVVRRKRRPPPAIELALLIAGRLQADVVLGIGPIDADKGRERLRADRLHVGPPAVINSSPGTCVLAFCEGNIVSR